MGWAGLWLDRCSPPVMAYASVAPLGLAWHTTRVTGWWPPTPAMIRSSCTSGVHTGTWSGTACREEGEVLWHPRCLHPPWFT